jgi:uncharacterized repeat protein (TIGR01451 family)
MVRVARTVTRKSLALLTSLVLVLFWVPGLVGASPASANTSGNQTLGGFEIDGNLYDGTANTSTATSHAASAADDWVNLMSGPTLSDPVGNADTTTFSGSKECGTDGDCETDSWKKGTGLASPKDDLSKVFVASRLVPDKTGDLWGYFGFERAANNGTTFFDFELNQHVNTANGNGVSRPVRTAGDVLIVAAQQGNNDFTISGSIQRWTTDNTKCDSGLVATKTAGGCWTVPAVLPNSATAFGGVANDSTITDLPSADGTLGANLFGEFAVNLSVAGAVVDCPSTGFVALNVRTRSSTSDSAETKDYATGPLGIPSACGELKIYKRDAATSALLGGATFTVTPNPATGTGSATVTDNVAPTSTTTGDSDATDGVIDINPAKPGQYSVQETGPPPGYLLPSTTTQTVTVAKFGSGADAATVTFNDTQIVTSLHLEKSASPTTYSSTSDSITYTYTATNTGNVPLTAPYAVTDDKATVTCNQTPSPLAVGAHFTCTATDPISQADLDAGSVTNHATATAKYLTTTVTSNQAQATVNANQTPALHLVKATTTASYNAAGQTLSYTYTLSNTGNVTLHAPYAVSDDKTSVTCPSTPATLAPGDTVQCSATYTTTQSDVDAGSVTNHATATAHELTATGPIVTSNQSQVTVNAVQGPALSLQKAATETSYDAAGQTLHYTYTLINSGNVTLSAPYAVTDDKTSVTCPSTPTTLAPGDTVQCHATYSTLQSDVDNGSVVNHATATAKFGTSTVTSNQATAEVPAVQKPKLTLEKAAAESSYNAPGQTLHYTYTLTNSGNVTLSAPYAVSDDKTSVTCPSTPATLPPGQSVQCSATYTTTLSDVDAGSVTNHATATAKFGDTTVTSNQAQVTVPAQQGPALSLTKAATETSFNAAGQLLHYAYTLTNSGNVSLAPPYAVTDDKTSVVCPTTPSALAPGQSVECAATYTTTQSDVDNGGVTNHAVATAEFGDTTVTSNQAQATVPADQVPALVLVKTAAEGSYSAVGDTLHYTYALSNAGNVTLSAPYAVSDDKTSVVCPSTPSTLAPTEIVQCTATYTVTQADIDAGSVINHATATALFGEQTVKSNEDQATVPAVQNPSLKLVKSVDQTSASYGGTLTYHFKVTNIGNTDLTGVVVSDVIPAKTAYVAGSASPNATFDSATKTVKWSVGNLASGASLSTLTFKVTITTPSFNSTVGLPPEVIDNVGAVLADTVSSTPSNHVKTPVTTVLGVKVVRKPKLPFTGVPAQELLFAGLLLLGAGIILTSVRRRQH